MQLLLLLIIFVLLLFDDRFLLIIWLILYISQVVTLREAILMILRVIIVLVTGIRLWRNQWTICGDGKLEFEVNAEGVRLEHFTFVLESRIEEPIFR